ncbi:MAG: hypothetical protein EAS51_03245 [Microbacteriaceae bacterium]|nr:MAG: hypothetical protein EAS51_03245 [Microbacteriaceae bacterium]
MNDHFDDAEARLRRAASAPLAPELDPALVTGAPDRRAPRLVRRGRAARAAGISLSAIAAVSVGALVVPGVLAPRAPLFTAAAGAGQEAAAFGDASRMMLWIDYRYVAGPGLSTDGGRGTVYQLARVGDPEGVLTHVAAALGVAGTPAESAYSSPEYPSYVVGPEDGSGPAITLGWSGTGSWWYNDPGAYPAAVCVDVPVAGGAEGETYQDCAQPEVPASESKAPSEAEARALAAEIFEASGLDVAPGDIRVTADSWQTLASASLVVDGTATALEYSVAWSPLGTISWATGHSIEVIERGDFDTVSPVAAVGRIAEGRWYGAAGPDYMGGMVAFAADGVARSAEDGGGEAGTEGSGVSGSEPGATEPADPGDPGVVLPEPGDPDAPATDEPIEELPIEEPVEEPTPEVVTVTLDRAEATLLMLWDVDGNAWLVPGYAFENPEGDFWTTIVSLVEGVIELPEPMQIEPYVDPAA